MKVRAISAVVVICILVLSARAGAQGPQAQTPTDYKIAGMVVDYLTMQPIAGASVQIAPVEDRAATRTVRTGPDGRFSFSGLARGKFSLGASFRGYPAQGLEQHDAYATAVAVGPEIDSSQIIFRLRPGASIRGRVVDEENDAVSNAMVRLFVTGTVNGRTGTRLVRMGNTDDQGSYGFSRLPEGTYFIAVSGRPWYAQWAQVGQMRAMRREAMKDSSGAEDEAPEETDSNQSQVKRTYPLTFYNGTTNSMDASPIELHPGDSATADITVRSAPVTHVRLASERTQAESQPEQAGMSGGGGGGPTRVDGMVRGSQPPRVEVFQRIFDDTLVSVETAYSSGEQGLELTGIPAGHYVIKVTKPGQADAAGAIQEVDIAGNMELPKGTIPTASVTGTVQFEETPPKGALVFLLHNEELQRTYGTRLTGSTEFETRDALLPGRYEMAISGAQGWYLVSVSATGAKLIGRTLQITGGEHVKVNLRVGHGLGEVNGTAMRNGKPSPGAMIVLVPHDPRNSSVLFRRDQSDSDGTFTLRDVVPGAYTVLAIQDGWSLAWTDPAVLRPYIAKGTSVQVGPSGKLQTQVTVQDR